MEIIFVLLILIVFVGIPIGISYLIYQLFKRNKVNEKYRILAIFPIIIVGYLIYDAICPNEDFYKKDFKEITNMELPKNAEIKFKNASFPDQFGDYTSSFLVEVEYDYVEKLEKELSNSNFIKKENKMSSEELDFIESKIDGKKYYAEYNKEIEGGKYYSVGILNDKKSIIITRASW